MADLADRLVQRRPELGLGRGESLQPIHRLLCLIVLTELMISDVIPTRHRFADSRVQMDFLSDRMLDQRRHHLLGQELDLVVGGSVHVFELTEHVVDLIVLVGEKRDHVSRCSGRTHARWVPTTCTMKRSPGTVAGHTGWVLLYRMNSCIGAGHSLLQEDQRLAEHARDVHLRDTDLLGDLGLSQLAEEPQRDDRPLPGREFSQQRT